LLAIVTAGCAKSSTGPTSGGSSPVVTRPVVSVTSVVTTGDRNGASGFRYRTVVTLRESAGANAPISAVDLTFVNGSSTLVASHHDRPISDASNTVQANSSIATRELLTTDDNASHAYATTVQVRVTYADSPTSSATASAAADVPPLPNQGPTTYTLTGVVSDESGRGIAGARVEAINGENAGKSAATDGSGGYSLGGLVGETFRLRASANGFNAGEQNVTVPGTPRADFMLGRPAPSAPCVYTVDPTNVNLTNAGAGQFSVNITRTSGGCGWQASTTAFWMTPAAPSGSGSATLNVNYLSNQTPNTRNGALTIAWDGGSAQVAVQQVRDLGPFCLGANLFVDGQSGGILNVPAAGGQYNASVSGRADIPGLCTSWSASASPGGVTFNPSSGFLSNPAATFTITVSRNPTSAPRTIEITVSVSGFGGGGSAKLTVNQGG